MSDVALWLVLLVLVPLLLLGLLGLVLGLAARNSGTSAGRDQRSARSVEQSAGLQLTRYDLVIMTSAEADAVLGSIRRDVASRAEPHPSVAALYLAAEQAQQLAYQWGTRARTSFWAVVRADPVPGGTRVLVQIARWTVADGVVVDGDRMQLLRDDVLAAVRTLDGGATPSLVGSP